MSTNACVDTHTQAHIYTHLGTQTHTQANTPNTHTHRNTGPHRNTQTHTATGIHQHTNTHRQEHTGLVSLLCVLALRVVGHDKEGARNTGWTEERGEMEGGKRVKWQGVQI